MKYFPMNCKANSERGYTIVEIVMSLAVLAIGVSGVIAMQKVTVTANRHAKNLSTATRIAQSWMSILEVESSRWATIEQLLPSNDWHKVGVDEASWFRPTYITQRNFGSGFDALGNPLSNNDTAHYCADLRIEELNNSKEDPVPISGVVRIEVRVAWIRDVTILGGTPTSACGLNAAELSLPAGISEMNFVHMNSAVRSVERSVTIGKPNFSP